MTAETMPLTDDDLDAIVARVKRGRAYPMTVAEAERLLARVRASPSRSDPAAPDRDTIGEMVADAAAHAHGMGQEEGFRRGVEAAAELLEEPKRIARLRAPSTWSEIETQGKVIATILEGEAAAIRSLSPSPATTVLTPAGAFTIEPGPTAAAVAAALPHPATDARPARDLDSAVRCLWAMVRHGNVQIHGDAAGLAAWDHLDTLLDGCRCKCHERTDLPLVPATCGRCVGRHYPAPSPAPDARPTDPVGSWRCGCGGFNAGHRTGCYKCGADRPPPEAPKGTPDLAEIERLVDVLIEDVDRRTFDEGSDPKAARAALLDAIRSLAAPARETEGPLRAALTEALRAVESAQIGISALLSKHSRPGCSCHVCIGRRAFLDGLPVKLARWRAALAASPGTPPPSDLTKNLALVEELSRWRRAYDSLAGRVLFWCAVTGDGQTPEDALERYADEVNGLRSRLRKAEAERDSAREVYETLVRELQGEKP